MHQILHIHIKIQLDQSKMWAQNNPYTFNFNYQFNYSIPFSICHNTIKVITKLPNSEQSYKGKVKTHNYINRQNQSTTGKL